MANQLYVQLKVAMAAMAMAAMVIAVIAKARAAMVIVVIARARVEMVVARARAADAVAAKVAIKCMQKKQI